jgi:hypothetical protein
MKNEYLYEMAKDLVRNWEIHHRDDKDRLIYMIYTQLASLGIDVQMNSEIAQEVNEAMALIHNSHAN